MISKLTLEVDKEFLEGYRSYKVDEILKDDNVSKVTYSVLTEFIENSTYNLNRLFEELVEDVDSLVLKFEDYSIKRNYKPSALTGIDDLFSDLM